MIIGKTISDLVEYGGIELLYRIINNFELLSNKTKELLKDYIKENLLFNNDYSHFVTNKEAINFIKKSMNKEEERKNNSDENEEEKEKKEKIELNNKDDNDEMFKERQKEESEEEDDNERVEEREIDYGINSIIENKKERKINFCDENDDLFKPKEMQIKPKPNPIQKNLFYKSIIVPQGEDERKEISTFISPKVHSTKCIFCQMNKSEIKTIGGKIAKLNVYI